MSASYTRPYSHNFHPSYYEPSAPSFENLNPYSGNHKPLYPSLTRAEPKQPDLNDDCCICLEKFKNKPEGDKSQFTVLSRTSCHHFFHKFCLNQHLERGMNTNCPLCRNPVDSSRVAHIKVKPISSKTAERKKPSHEDLSTVKPVVTSGLRTVGAVGLNLLKSAYGFFTPSNEELQKTLTLKTNTLFENWKKTVKNSEAYMQKAQEELSILFATINSLPSSNVNYSNRAIQRIEKGIQSFEKEFEKKKIELKHIIEEESKNLSEIIV